MPIDVRRRTFHRAPVLCPFRRVTGFPCPSCGLTRSLRSAAAGRPHESFRYHPLGLPIALVLLVVLGARPFRFTPAAAPVDARLSPHYRTFEFAAIAIIVATWVIRLGMRPQRRLLLSAASDLP